MLPKFEYGNTALPKLAVLTLTDDSFELLGDLNQLWISESANYRRG